MKEQSETVDKLLADLRATERRIKVIDAKLSVFNEERGKLITKRDYLESLLVTTLKLNPQKFFRDYSNMSLTESILDIVSRAAKPLSAVEILEFLESGGFESKSKNPYTNVYVMALKLANRGLIQESEREGKRVFSGKSQ